MTIFDIMGYPPPDADAPCGDPLAFICSGEINSPGIKVFASENAWNAAIAAAGRPHIG